jgi:hypothetical protein
MIYIALVLVIAIIVLRIMSPKRYAVHASTATPLPANIRPEGRWLLAGFLRDERGRLVDVDRKFIGTAVRDSMAAFGIPDGATFVGEYVREEDRSALKLGAVVVVDGPHANSETGLRLRRIEAIEQEKGQVEFADDGLGKPHRPRPVSDIVAVVTHVVKVGGSKRGLLTNMIARGLPASRH